MVASYFTLRTMIWHICVCVCASLVHPFLHTKGWISHPGRVYGRCEWVITRGRDKSQRLPLISSLWNPRVFLIIVQLDHLRVFSYHSVFVPFGAEYPISGCFSRFHIALWFGIGFNESPHWHVKRHLVGYPTLAYAGEPYTSPPDTKYVSSGLCECGMAQTQALIRIPQRWSAAVETNTVCFAKVDLHRFS